MQRHAAEFEDHSAAKLHAEQPHDAAEKADHRENKRDLTECLPQPGKLLNGL